MSSPSSNLDCRSTWLCPCPVPSTYLLAGAAPRDVLLDELVDIACPSPAGVLWHPPITAAHNHTSKLKSLSLTFSGFCQDGTSNFQQLCPNPSKATSCTCVRQMTRSWRTVCVYARPFERFEFLYFSFSVPPLNFN